MEPKELRAVKPKRVLRDTLTGPTAWITCLKVTFHAGTATVTPEATGQSGTYAPAREGCLRLLTRT